MLTVLGVTFMSSLSSSSVIKGVLMGGAGYMAGEMQRLFREARLGPIGGGTSEILRNVIGKRMGLF